MTRPSVSSTYTIRFSVQTRTAAGSTEMRMASGTVSGEVTSWCGEKNTRIVECDTLASRRLPVADESFEAGLLVHLYTAPRIDIQSMNLDFTIVFVFIDTEIFRVEGLQLHRLPLRRRMYQLEVIP